MAGTRASSIWARRLGETLRLERERVGLTTHEAGEAIEVNQGSMSRYENGKNFGGLKRRDIVDLLETYRSDEATVRRALRLFENARRKEWYEDAAHILDPAFRDYLALEDAATEIDSYHATVIPGFLQTKEYARAILRTGWTDATLAEDYVTVRMQWQERALHGTPARPVRVLLGEAALRSPYGGWEVLRGQLKHLVQVALPEVEIRVLPFEGAAHDVRAAVVPFFLLSFEEGARCVYAEGVTRGTLIEDPGEAVTSLEVFNRMWSAAEPVAVMAGAILAQGPERPL